MDTSRRRILQVGAGSALAMPFVRKAWAQDKSIQVGIYNGPQGEFFRKVMMPKFEADYGCKVFADGGVTLGQISRLRATKDSPKYSVMFMDDIGVDVAKREGLIAPLDPVKIPNLAKVIPQFVVFDSHAAGFNISTGGIAYNPTATKAPKSYAELWEPKYKKRVAIVGAETTQGVFMVIAAAAVATGKSYQEAQYLSEAAWPALEKLKANVATMFADGQPQQLLIQGDADVAAIGYSKTVYPYKLKKAPVDMSLPTEGAFAAVNCITLVKNCPEPELANAFINRVLDASVQKPMAEATNAGPSITGLSIDPALAEVVPYPESRMAELKLFSGDWVYLNTVRSAWIEKYNRIFLNA